MPMFHLMNWLSISFYQMILLYPRRLKIAELSKENILKYAQTYDEELTYLEPLKIEASGRKYFRASSEQAPMSFHLMIASKRPDQFLLIEQMN